VIGRGNVGRRGSVGQWCSGSATGWGRLDITTAAVRGDGRAKATARLRAVAA
jgi:hypothetical protein